jgi:hypothetical protein
MQFGYVTQPVTLSNTYVLLGMKLIESNMEIVRLSGVELLHFILEGVDKFELILWLVLKLQTADSSQNFTKMLKEIREEVYY